MLSKESSHIETGGTVNRKEVPVGLEYIRNPNLINPVFQQSN
jgi:hypothetical protein